MSKHAENALQHSLDKCERRLEAAERELAAYETLRDACEDSPDYLDPDISAALADLRRLDREKP